MVLFSSSLNGGEMSFFGRAAKWLPLAVTALFISTAIVLLLSSTPSQHGIPTLYLPRVQVSTAWVEPVGDEPQSEIEAIWAAHAAKHMAFGKVHRPRRPAEARQEVREEAGEEAAGDEVRQHGWSEGKCEGKCCSNAAPALAPGVPKMTSLWLSSQLAHGARVIVRTKTWGTWWAAADGVNWEGRVGRVYSTPSASQALTIIRVSDSEFQFLTPSNTFLTKAASMFLETTTNASDPLTVFTIEYIPDTVYVVFKSSDGWYISQNGENGPQFWWQGEPGDWERLDVREIMWVPAIRGANLGSWLMTEPWMNREVFKFAGYSDGTRFTLRSVISGQYVTAPGGGGTIMTCNGSLNKDAYLHLTTVRNASSNTRRIAVQWLQYWAVRDNSPNVWVQSTEPEGAASNFELFIYGIPLNKSTEQRGGDVRVVLRAPNGLFLQANPDGSLTADLMDSLNNDAIWSSAAAFDLSVLWRVEADWQAAYTAGAAAPSIYENIRRNFIKEADWQKMQELGVNTVRIPLGYWIGLDASPEFPFVPGAVTYLDWAFEMGRKYGVRIWFSVHVAPGSQAGKGNARDGLIRWRGANINRTLDFVTWLADRYGADPMWLGMGLLNEPVVGGANGYAGVDLEDMRGYYSAAFNAIRARCLCCFVAMEGRVGSNFGDVMWHMNDAWHNNVILEQHIYDVFGNFFSSQGVNFELDYAYTTRVNNIVSFQEKVGRQLLVGEFCNAMGNPATPEQQANFSLAQMKAFSHAKAGWFFWSWKLNTTGTHHWQFVNSYERGWLPKKPDVITRLEIIELRDTPSWFHQSSRESLTAAATMNVEAILRRHPSKKLRRVLEDPSTYRFQVLVSEVTANANGQPCLRRQGYRVDHEYFYPASAIKLCAAVVALLRVAEYQARGVNVSLNSPLSFLPLYPGDKEESHDPSNLNGGHITIAHEIRKMFLVSSNTAYNRLYAFTGQRRLNEAMHSLGLSSAHLSHRLSLHLSPLDNRRCEPVRVGLEANAPEYCFPPKWSSVELPPVEGVEGLLVGRAYIDANGTQVNAPLDFSPKNRLTLVDLQNLLVLLMRPDIQLPGCQPIGLDEGHRLLLLEAMRQYPRESRNPRYADKKYTDDYCKFFLPGLCRVRPKEALRIYNKIGQAFGFTIDNAYILDIETGREFFLSLALYTNENSCLNDDKYEYDLAYDVAADVAEAIAMALWDDKNMTRDQDVYYA
ncbi:unnamed protein product [Closterium sp. Yama58-4]|nr:unnamed protein product [Closterium sp. Yama58-4]